MRRGAGHSSSEPRKFPMDVESWRGVHRFNNNDRRSLFYGMHSPSRATSPTHALDKFELPLSPPPLPSRELYHRCDLFSKEAVRRVRAGRGEEGEERGGRGGARGNGKGRSEGEEGRARRGGGGGEGEGDGQSRRPAPPPPRRARCSGRPSVRRLDKLSPPLTRRSHRHRPPLRRRVFGFPCFFWSY